MLLTVTLLSVVVFFAVALIKKYFHSRDKQKVELQEKIERARKIKKLLEKSKRIRSHQKTRRKH